MGKRIAFLHTVTSLLQVFKDLAGELIPDADIFNIIDESLLQNTIRSGQLEPITFKRVAGYLASAEQAGAKAVLVTCSSIGPAVDVARGQLGIPIFRVDEPMAVQAVRTGHRIGVAATLMTTMEPTTNLIIRLAKEEGRKVEVLSKLCEGAFEAIISGDTYRHDAIVSAGLQELAENADVIVLAQASMARVADALPQCARKIPVLSSPRLAMTYFAEKYPGF